MWLVRRKRIVEVLNRRILAARQIADQYDDKGDASAAGRWESIAYELEEVLGELTAP